MNWRNKWVGIGLIASVLIGSPVLAQNNRGAAPTTEPADVPAFKGQNKTSHDFIARHEGFLKDLKKLDGNCGILFVGDSITDGWRGDRGKEVFEKNYGSMHPFNIGIGGDKTQHVLWRLDHDEVDGISPKVAVLMIGTNNLGTNSDDEIVAGISRIVKDLNQKLPKTKVLLLGVFPRSPNADHPFRARIKAINSQIAQLDDNGEHVKYLDIGGKFLEPDGSLSKDIMPDYLHPNTKGYEIWAEAMAPTLKSMME
jgi:lysophospholipase L1-like esterase